MKIVAWNMAHRLDGWDALEALDADISLLTEARVPAGSISGHVLGGEETKGLDGFRRPWASAVASAHDIREITDARASRRGRPIDIPFTPSRPGSWTAAVVPVPDIGPVTTVALYGLMDEKSDASVHRSLSELTPLFEDDRYRQLIVLGGDLNTWTGWKAGTAHLARDRTVLDRIAALGLRDCLKAKRADGRLEGCPCSLEACDHTRTRRDARYPNVPYQMDYLFASPALLQRLTSCEAIDGMPGDHFAIVATFE
jgi:hypothetical protein